MLRDETIQRVLKFRDDRNWRQFHTPKDLALSLSPPSCWRYFSGAAPIWSAGKRPSKSGKNWRTC